MSRQNLPQNYIKSTGTLLEDFENQADWTLGGTYPGRTKEDNAVQYLTGAQSIKVSVANVAGSAMITKAISAVSLSSAKNFRLGVYLHSPITVAGKIQLYFSSVSNFASYMYVTFRPVHLSQNHWVYLVASPSDFTSYNGESWANQMVAVRINVESAAGQINMAASLDELRIQMGYTPRLLFTFDDNRSTVYSVAYPYMHDRGVRGTVYAIRNLVLGDANYMSLANLQTLYADGWDIGNHTTTHVDQTGLTQAQVEAELNTCTSYLVENGMPRAARHAAYPMGQFNSSVLAAMAATGMTTGRANTTGTTELYPQQFTPCNSLYTINSIDCQRTTSLATVKTLLNKAINKGVTLILVFHRFADTPTESTQWASADFRALVDYVIARRIKCLTIDEWYRGLTDPRYESSLLSRS